jgi:uncharacterized membrane protein YfcA
MELARLGLLALAAAAAGVINSIAGGGSIISFPAALAAGLPPVTASATNTLALAPGSLASAYALRRELGENRRLLPWLLVPAAAGALAGAVALVSAPPRVFEVAVPWLILVATLLLVFREALEKRAATRDAPPSRRRSLGVAVALGVLSVYGGYFGAGMGILTLAVISLLRKLDIHRLNALKNIVVGSINAVAAAFFVASGAADLLAAAVMAAGAACGGYCAASVARRIDPRIVSWVVAGMGVLLSALLALRYWS